MFKTKDNLDIIAYGAAVQEIAQKFFDDDGNYAPHIGKANAMLVFYNYFVIESKFNDIPTEEFNTDQFFADDEFLAEYNKALNDNKTARFNFGNAYADALDIVNTRKTSLRYSFEIIEKALTSLLDKFSTTINEEELAKLTSMLEKISQDGFVAEGLKKAYEKSGRIEQIAG